jgi:hypothetical protein
MHKNYDYLKKILNAWSDYDEIKNEKNIWNVLSSSANFII